MLWKIPFDALARALLLEYNKASSHTAVSGPQDSFLRFFYICVVSGGFERFTLIRGDDEHSTSHKLAIGEDALKFVCVVLSRLRIKHSFSECHA